MIGVAGWHVPVPADKAGDFRRDRVAFWGGWLLLAWAMLAPLTIPLSAPGGIRLAISDLLGIVTLAVLPFVLMTRGRFGRLAPILLVLGWALVSTLYNLDGFPSSVQAMFRLMRAAFNMSPMMLALLIGDELDEKHRNAILNAYIAASLGGMAIGLVMNQLDISIADVQTYDFGRGLVARAAGLTGDSSAFGHLGASGLAVVICLLVTERRPGPLRLLLCCAMLAILPAFFYASMSRAFLVNILAVIVALILLAAAGAYDRARLFSRIAGALMVATVLIGMVATAFPVETRAAIVRLDLDSLTEFADDPEALIDRLGSGRGNVWSDTIALAKSNPVLGVGYKGLQNRYFIPGDNIFLTAFAELGTIGGALVMGLVGLVAILTLSALFQAGREDMAAAIAAPLWFGQVANMMLSDVASYYSSFPVVLIIVALAITAPRRKAAPAMASWRRVPGRES